MSTWTLYGSDGRRIEHSVAESYAKEQKAKIEAETGEELSLVEDEAPEDLVASSTKAKAEKDDKTAASTKASKDDDGEKAA